MVHSLDAPAVTQPVIRSIRPSKSANSPQCCDAGAEDSVRAPASAGHGPRRITAMKRLCCAEKSQSGATIRSPHARQSWRTHRTMGSAWSPGARPPAAGVVQFCLEPRRAPVGQAQPAIHLLSGDSPAGDAGAGACNPRTDRVAGTRRRRAAGLSGAVAVQHAEVHHGAEPCAGAGRAAPARPPSASRPPETPPLGAARAPGGNHARRGQPHQPDPADPGMRWVVEQGSPVRPGGLVEVRPRRRRRRR